MEAKNITKQVSKSFGESDSTWKYLSDSSSHIHTKKYNNDTYSEEYGLHLIMGNVCESNSTIWRLTEPVCSINFSSFGILVSVAILLSIIMLWTVFGNALVCYALYRFPKLRSISNCLIGNLAISDFLLALTVMPISTGNDLLGYWVFGKVTCMMWLCSDVLYCTASIWGLCTIAVDRYTATNYPVWYFERKSPKRALVYIIFVWIFSIIVSFAPFIGWREMIPELYQYNPVINRYECILFQTGGYVVYSAMGSFVIPIVLMGFIYIRIFMVLKQRMKLLKPKRNVSHPSESDIESGIIPDSNSRVELNAACTQMKDQATQISPVLAKSSGNFLLESKGCVLNTNNHSSLPNNASSNVDDPCPKNTKDESKAKIDLKLKYGVNLADVTNTEEIQIDIESPTAGTSDDRSLDGSKESFPNILSSSRTKSDAQVDDDIESTESHSHESDHNSCSQTNIPTLSTELPKINNENGHCQQNNREIPKEKILRARKEKTTYNTPLKNFFKKKQDAHTRKRNLSITDKGRRHFKRPKHINGLKTKYELREQRATKRMGIVMACFCVCWIPFLFMYTIRSFCVACDLNVHIQAAIIWLGYANSALNPILYTLFNDDFRKAFKTILHLDSKRRQRKKKQKKAMMKS